MKKANNMYDKKLALFFFSLCFLLILNSGNCENLNNKIEETLNKLHGLKMMIPDQEYTVPIGTMNVTGRKEDFLRLRNGEEILSSGLSSGCGDYAIAFYELITKSGYEALFIDSAEMSISSLINRYNGHTAVAVKEPETDKWILIDPTNAKIINKDWDISSKIYRTSSGSFWIGYIGKWEDYPYKSPKKLREFYDETLKKIPTDVLNKEIIKLEFALEKAGDSEKSVYFNKRIPDFIEKYSKIYDKFGLNPTRHVKIILSAGSEDSTTECKEISKSELKCFVGANSAMSESLFLWFDQKVKISLNMNPKDIYEKDKDSDMSLNIEFASDTVKRISKAFKVKFIEDKSFKKSDGSYVNPYYNDFKNEYSDETGFPVYIYDNGDNAESFCEVKNANLVCFLGRRSGLGKPVYELIENSIQRLVSDK